ncbi:FIST signal transduction protein [Rubrivirga sp. IMCC43871]|uniref:FIST signal transduction protein n=1 Tax=Rubrivirga sp. IMCC43871 TaxID=3391575 RepID=UPI00398FA39B
MTVATGHSEDIDSADAIAEALDACADALAGKTPQAGLLYAGIDHDFQALLDGVEARYPGVQLIGCTTHGEFSSDGIAEDSVVLMLFHSDRVQFGVGVAEDARADPEGAAQRSIAAARDGLAEPVRLAIVLPEGLGVDSDRLLDAVSAELGDDVPVCGGMAGDQVRFTGTYQFCNGRVYSDAVPALLFAGPLHVSTGVASGWEPMGDDHVATRVEGLVIHEIDGRPPHDLWMQYFGSFEVTGNRNFFAVYPDQAAGTERSDEFYICAPSHFQDDGSMVTLNPALHGARVRFAMATRDQILSGASTSSEQAQAAYGTGTPDAALVFSCGGRHLTLGTRVGDELGLMQQHIGTTIPAIGFYTNGEICPLPSSPRPYQHGGTFVTVLIGEDA